MRARNYMGEEFMRGAKAIRWMAVSVVLLFALPATATFRDDYAQFENERTVLEAERREYEGKARKLEEDRRSSEKDYLECASGRWQVLWQKRTEEADEARKQLEKQNEELTALNSSLRDISLQLENERQEIEQTHVYKNSKYEAALRTWMEKVRTRYYFRLQHELFRGYEEYQSGIEKYIIFVNNAAKLCSKRDYTEAAISAAVSLIPQILAAVETIKDIFSRQDRRRSSVSILQGHDVSLRTLANGPKKSPHSL